MSAWTWFMLIGVAVAGLIARYSFGTGDYAWGVIASITAVACGLIAIYEVSKGWPKSDTPAAPTKPRKCGANSGALFGYACDLDKGHEGQHEAVISRTTDTFSGREVGRKTVSW